VLTGCGVGGCGVGGLGLWRERRKWLVEFVFGFSNKIERATHKKDNKKPQMNFLAMK
jgi:hypothetical protein